MQAKMKIDLQWKEHNVNLEMVNSKLKQDCPKICGTQAASCLEVWFTEEPTQEEKDAVIAYWESLDEASAEATGYKSRAQIEADVEAKRQSAIAKFAALGLTDAEIAAIIG